MRLRGQTVFSLLLVAIGCYTFFYSFHWSFKARFFPQVTSLPLVILVIAHLFLELFGKAEKATGPAVELELSTAATPELARRRALVVFAWIAGFIVLVYLASFPVAVPVFIFAYLKTQSSVGWLPAFGYTAAAWGFFYVVFQRLLYLPFESGVLQSWLGM